MSSRTKIGLGFEKYFGAEEVFDLTKPSVFYPEPEPEPIEKRFPPLYSSFVRPGEMHEVPPTITGTFKPPSYESDLIDKQVISALESDTYKSESSSESNDFVSCDHSDKSSDSEAS